MAWELAQEGAFVRLKQVLTQAPVLAYADFEQPFVQQRVSPDNPFYEVQAEDGSGHLCTLYWDKLSLCCFEDLQPLEPILEGLSDLAGGLDGRLVDTPALRTTCELPFSRGRSWYRSLGL